MSPVYLNKPSPNYYQQAPDRVDDQEEQFLKLFLSSPLLPYHHQHGHQAAAPDYSRQSFPTFFDYSSSLEDHHRGLLSSTNNTSTLGADHQPLLDNQWADKLIWHGETSYDHLEGRPPSSLAPSVVDDVRNAAYLQNRYDLSIYTDEINMPVKAIPNCSEVMRIPDQKVQQRLQTGHHDDHRPHTSTSSLISNSKNNSSTNVCAVRVCSDCGTSTTPLWRSGPRGPKSLCNACGIRRRKARKSVAEEAAAAAPNGIFKSGTTADSTTSSKDKGEQKKTQASHNNVTVHCKNKRKLVVTDSSTTGAASLQNTYETSNKKLCNIEQLIAFPPSTVVFPPDVSEAAILLMELSRGLIN